MADMIPPKEWTKDRFNDLSMRNHRACERAIVRLYDLQEADERASGMTRKANGVGFTAHDAQFLSSLGKRLKAGHSLTPAQLAAIRRPNKGGYMILSKYHAQLRDMVAQKQNVEPPLTLSRERAVEGDVIDVEDHAMRVEAMQGQAA